MPVEINDEFALCQKTGGIVLLAEGHIVADDIGVAGAEALVDPVDVLQLFGRSDRNGFCVGSRAAEYKEQQDHQPCGQKIHRYFQVDSFDGLLLHMLLLSDHDEMTVPMVELYHICPLSTSLMNHFFSYFQQYNRKFSGLCTYWKVDIFLLC